MAGLNKRARVKKRRPEAEPCEHHPSELCEVVLGSDGSIGVKARTIREAKKTALELHRRQRRRMFLDYEYR